MQYYTVLIALAMVAIVSAGVIPETPKDKRQVYLSHPAVVAAHAPVVAHAPVALHAPSHALSTSYSSVSISHPVPVAVAHAPVAVAHAPVAVAHAPVAVAHAPVVAHPVYASHYTHTYLH